MHLYYDVNEYNLGETADYYFDPEDNANWIYDGEEESIELKNIENSQYINSVRPILNVRSFRI